ncbi:hypothetical protein E5288_WYG006926 [Bos mutus]|uniref:Uncharacterized protein n=1 Tax=Bos mutus TaxID=72004 RepID=A0A6B0QRC2_9CETA|nr:hypothetical protein [Bos mutus]
MCKPRLVNIRLVERYRLFLWNSAVTGNSIEMAAPGPEVSFPFSCGKVTSANFNGKGTLGWNIKVNTLTGSSGKGQDQKPKDQQEAQRIHLHRTGLVMNHRCSHSGARGHTKGEYESVAKSFMLAPSPPLVPEIWAPLLPLIHGDIKMFTDTLRV